MGLGASVETRLGGQCGN